MKKGKETNAFLLHVQKGYHTVWQNSLWSKLWEFGVKGKMWRVIKEMKEMYVCSVLLDGERSEALGIEQGVAPEYSLSFSMFINGLLREVEEAEIGLNKVVVGNLDDFICR